MLALVALGMWAMKRYYADAPIDELRWILGPTARVVTALTSAPFEWEPGQGYLSREPLFLIEKACAGLNFMIAAFGMVACVFGRRVTSGLSGAGVLSLSVLASYSAAVLVNAVRITVAMRLAAHPLPIAWITSAQVHRLRVAPRGGSDRRVQHRDADRMPAADRLPCCSARREARIAAQSCRSAAIGMNRRRFERSCFFLLRQRSSERSSPERSPSHA